MHTTAPPGVAGAPTPETAALEVEFLLPFGLEAAANRRGLTVAQLFRRLIRDYLSADDARRAALRRVARP